MFFRLVFLLSGTHTCFTIATSERPALEPFPGFLWAPFHPWVQFRMLNLLKLLGSFQCCLWCFTCSVIRIQNEKDREDSVGSWMVSHCWNGPFGGQLGWQQMWAHDDKYKKKPWKKNKEQKEREVLARWMERTQLRAREGGNIQTCWMFIMSSLGIHLLKEASVCCRLGSLQGLCWDALGKEKRH